MITETNQIRKTVGFFPRVTNTKDQHKIANNSVMGSELLKMLINCVANYKIAIK
jgi:hypothetical protein